MIKQIYVSQCVEFFKNFIINKYKIKNYSNKKTPALFLGCYTKRDLNIIKKHRGLKIVIFGGTDINQNIIGKKQLKKKFSVLKRLKNIHFISLSDFIANIFQSRKIRHIRMSLCFVDKQMGLYPVVKGSSIYIYGNLLANDGKKYNRLMLYRIIQALPYVHFFVLYYHNSFEIPFPNVSFVSTTRDKIIEYYAKCFIGLRLTNFDGNANTVQELGLCGIKCVFNGDRNLPNTIRWNTFDDIMKAIRQEQLNVGTSNPKLAYEVAKYLDDYDQRQILLSPTFYRKYNYKLPYHKQSLYQAKRTKNSTAFVPDLTKINPSELPKQYSW